MITIVMVILFSTNVASTIFIEIIISVTVNIIIYTFIVSLYPISNMTSIGFITFC